jgi:hypothetical protein
MNNDLSSAARGIINAILISIVIWAIIACIWSVLA